MTSGHFTSHLIDTIWVERDKRQRRELVGIKELAESIQRSGLINPIVVKHDGELVAGERRWTACKSLGWTHINVQFLEDLSESEVQLVELEENVRRVDLPWQDQCRALERYHTLRAQENPSWTVAATAETLGLSQSEVSNRRAVAKELDAGNTRVAEAPKYSVARGIVTREAERKRDSVIADVKAITKGEAAPVRVAPLLNVDFHEWASSYTDTPFNFIHCDFPYGVNADNHAQGAASAFGGYEDSADVYWKLLDTLKLSMQNVVAESAHLMFWFSMDYYQTTSDVLKNMGWTVQPFPLIWHKSDNMGILPDPSRGPRRIYETCLIASRGDRKIIRAVSNVVSNPTTKLIHMSEKPVAMLSKFMEMFVDGYSRVLDPTCGSGNALKAAEERGASAVLGLEKSEEFFTRAKGAYYNDDLI